MLWGPAAGWLAKETNKQAGGLDVVPLLREPDRPPLAYRIAMGVRHGENEWKRVLNTALRKRRAESEAVLRDYGVPLLDEEESKLLPADAKP